MSFRLCSITCTVVPFLKQIPLCCFATRLEVVPEGPQKFKKKNGVSAIKVMHFLLSSPFVFFIIPKLAGQNVNSKVCFSFFFFFFLEVQHETKIRPLLRIHLLVAQQLEQGGRFNKCIYFLYLKWLFGTHKVTLRPFWLAFLFFFIFMQSSRVNLWHRGN